MPMPQFAKEPSIIIASHSSRAPVVGISLLDGFPGPLDLNTQSMTLDDTGDSSDSLTIDVCEVQFNFHNSDGSCKFFMRLLG